MEQNQTYTAEQIKQMVEEAIANPGEFAKVFGNIPAHVLLHLNTLLVIVLLNQAKIVDAALFKIANGLMQNQQVNQEQGKPSQD